MKKKLTILYAGLLLGLTPFMASAQATALSCTLPNKANLAQLIDYVVCLIAKSVIPLIFALATIMFLWGVVQYVINANDEKERTRGKQFMIWGIIALVVMFSIWGLVNIVTTTFDIDFSTPQLRQ